MVSSSTQLTTCCSFIPLTRKRKNTYYIYEKRKSVYTCTKYRSGKYIYIYIWRTVLNICPYRPYMSSRAQLNIQECSVVFRAHEFVVQLNMKCGVATLFAGRLRLFNVSTNGAAAYVTWLGVRKERSKNY